jgi:hypothetical protein
MSLSKEQFAELLKPIDPARVSTDGKGFAHVEAWDIRRTMNHIFGFGNWSADVTEMVLIAENPTTTKQGKPAWNVIYRAKCTLRIGEPFDGGASYTEWAAGEATNPVLGDAHDQAIKTAESQALKRCAVNLGDQFGLSLYKHGSTEATVGETLGQTFDDAEKVPVWVAAFEAAESLEQINDVAGKIKGASISRADRSSLLMAYGVAKKRIEVA